MTHRRSLIFVLLICFGSPALPLGTFDFTAQLIDDIQYTVNQQGQAEITVHFSIPIRYFQATEATNANRADARIEFYLTEKQKQMLPLEEVRIADRDPEIPLHSVTYDGFNVDDALVSIQFDKKVTYDVRRTGNESIVITLPDITPSQTPLNLISEEEMARIKEKLRTAGVQPPPAQPRQTQPQPVQKTQPESKPLVLPPEKAQVTQPNDKAVAILMAQGRAALTRADNRAAVKLFTQILNAQNHSYRADALELLGLARERNGQTGFAQRIYNQYLKKYPEGEGHDRVVQRIADLSPPEVVPTGTLKQGRSVAAGGLRSDTFGSVSVYSFQGRQNTGGNDINTVQSYLNLTNRLRSSRYDFRTVMYGTVTQRNNLEADDDDKPTEFEANRFYMDMKDSRLDYNARFGRQSGNAGGIFGRFDGLLFGKNITSTTRVHGAAGYTVDFIDENRLQTNKPFFSTYLNLGSYWQYLDISPYWFHQQIDGITNRTAAGIEGRWNHPKFSVFGVADYETNYGIMNMMMLNGLWQWSKATSLNVNVDKRRNPLLQTENVLNNTLAFSAACQNTDQNTIATGVDPNAQEFTSIEDALRECSEEFIQDFADKGTGVSNILTFAVNHRLSNRYQINADITRIKTTIKELVEQVQENEEIRFIDEEEEQDQFAYSVQWIVNNFFLKRDSNIFGLRLVNDENYDSMIFNYSNRFAYGRAWRFSTRFIMENRTSALATNEYLRFRPSFKVDYRIGRTMDLQLEILFDDISYADNTNPDYNSQLLTVGFRQDF